jgi:hypothetical protein
MLISYKFDKKLVYGNVKLIGNIIYELLIDIQDNLLETSPLIYKVGNW